MNGFGGVCSKFLEILRDDIPKIPTMAFGFYDKEMLDKNVSVISSLSRLYNTVCVDWSISTYEHVNELGRFD